MITCLSSFEKYLLWVYCPLFKVFTWYGPLFLFVFTIEYLEFPTYFGYHPLVRYVFYKYVLLFCGVVLYSAVQKLLVWCDPICLFFSFVSYAFGDLSITIPLSTPLTFTSSNSIASDFTWESLTHLETLFVAMEDGV
jgi:hypothetical protein